MTFVCTTHPLVYIGITRYLCQMMKEGCGRHMFLCQKQPLNLLVIKDMRVNEQGRESKNMLEMQSKVN